MATYVWSDPHFYHKNILAFTDRPFDTVEEMNEALFASLESTVGERDTLFILGDLYFGIGGNRKAMVDRLRSFHCKELWWILGNHDEPKRCRDLVGLFDHVVHAHSFKYRKRIVFLSHYGLNIPEGDRQRLVSIHGHSHGASPNPPGRIDVGVDSLYGLREHFDFDYNFEPLHIDTAMNLAEMDLPAGLPAKPFAMPIATN